MQTSHFASHLGSWIKTGILFSFSILYPSFGVGDSAFEIEGKRETFPIVDELAKKLRELDTQSREVRHKLLTLQDALAGQAKAISRISISLAVNNKGIKQGLPLGIKQLWVTLNDIPLASYQDPVVFEDNARFPLFQGPLPYGNYILRLRGVAGVMQFGWPFALLQGAWGFQNDFSLAIDHEKDGKSFVFLLQPGSQGPILVQEETQ